MKSLASETANDTQRGAATEAKAASSETVHGLTMALGKPLRLIIWRHAC
jgi:hypothetical protein